MLSGRTPPHPLFFRLLPLASISPQNIPSKGVTFNLLIPFDLHVRNGLGRPPIEGPPLAPSMKSQQSGERPGAFLTFQAGHIPDTFSVTASRGRGAGEGETSPAPAPSMSKPTPAGNGSTRRC